MKPHSSSSVDPHGVGIPFICLRSIVITGLVRGMSASQQQGGPLGSTSLGRASLLTAKFSI
jgi:hypothetical protein